MLARLPAKGAILGFAVLAASLTLTARWADRGVHTVKALRKKLEAADRVDPDLHAALPPAFAAALAGIPAAGVPAERVPADGGPAFVPLAHSSALELRDQSASSRPPGWVYPDFDPAGPSGHGVPLGAIPRNLGLRFVDTDGELLYPESLRGTQFGDDGEFDIHGYRSSEALPWWTIGSPALTQGSRATFELEVTVSGELWRGSFELASVPDAVDVDLPTPVELARER